MDRLSLRNNDQDPSLLPVGYGENGGTCERQWVWDKVIPGVLWELRQWDFGVWGRLSVRYEGERGVS